MNTRQPRHKHCILFPLAAILAVSALGTGRAAAQFVITEIIDATGGAPGFPAADAWWPRWSGTKGTSEAANGKCRIDRFTDWCIL